VQNTFFIVGPTAVGKSELAADVARNLDAEIVSADAFQIYRGLDLLTAKPDAVTLAKVPHHLVGTMSILQEMNAEKFRRSALDAIADIHSRGKLAMVVGGSGLYIKALTHGLTSDWKKSDIDPPGFFVFRERAELHARINQRVKTMFENGVLDEVRGVDEIGSTASKMIGFREIQQHLNGKMSVTQCIEKIRAATRQYAKRQLTWFRHQTSFESLNLSLLTYKEAAEPITRRGSLLDRAKG
jgi:tRNA A37 N6-isopentenylltransferase MiaA